MCIKFYVEILPQISAPNSTMVLEQEIRNEVEKCVLEDMKAPMEVLGQFFC